MLDSRRWKSKQQKISITQRKKERNTLKLTWIDDWFWIRLIHRCVWADLNSLWAYSYLFMLQSNLYKHIENQSVCVLCFCMHISIFHAGSYSAVSTRPIILLKSAQNQSSKGDTLFRFLILHEKHNTTENAFFSRSLSVIDEAVVVVVRYCCLLRGEPVDCLAHRIARRVLLSMYKTFQYTQFLSSLRVELAPCIYLRVDCMCCCCCQSYSLMLSTDLLLFEAFFCCFCVPRSNRLSKSQRLRIHTSV